MKAAQSAPRSRYIIGGRVMTSVSLPPDLKGWVETCAESEGISQNEFIVRAIEERIAVKTCD
jgi:hypothetical protein